MTSKLALWLALAFLFFQMKIVFLLFLSIGVLGAAGLMPVKLRVEFAENPVGVSATPRFSWNLSGEGRGGMQKGYEILAAKSAKYLTADQAGLWNAKAPKSNQRSLIAWQGEKLVEGQKVFWKVRVTDQENVISEWSEVAHFTVGRERMLGPVAQVASFECSNEVLNEIFKRNVTTLRKRIDGYLAGDLAALGTGHEVQRSTRDLLYLFESLPVLIDWTERVYQGQNKIGYFPGGPGQPIAPVHSDAAIFVPHTLWWMSGDPSLISSKWQQMENYMIRRERSDPKIKGVQWGAPLEMKEEMSIEFVDLCYFGMTSRLMTELSAPATKPNNSIRYRDYSARIRKNFKEQYFDHKGQLIVPGQAAAILALRSSVMDAQTRQPVIDSLIKEMKSVGNIGSLSAKPLLPVLNLTGNHQKAFELVTDPKGPWADPAREDFVACGVAEWLMNSIAGIDTSSPGFRQFQVSPRIPEGDGLTWVKASYRAPSGELKVHWEKKEKALHVKSTVPKGALAILTLPLKEGQTIIEGGKTVEESFGAAIMRQDAVQGTVSVILQSGLYHFVIE